MPKLLICLLAFGALLAYIPAVAQNGFDANATPRDLNSLLEPIRAKHNLPALAAAIVTGEKLIALGAVGVRKLGDTVEVTKRDQFHLGSDTKSMTATLVAMQIEAGKLAWTTTLADAFPEFAATMQPAYRNVTIEQIMAHRAGFSGETTLLGGTLNDLRDLPGNPREQRKIYVEKLLKEPPVNTPGTQYVYSNRSYAVLGAIAERTANTAWEELITQRLFKPLGMTTTGFGAMGTRGKINQPWQHTIVSGKAVPIEPGPRSDNPDAIAPAGKVHCDMEDWAKFVALHLRGEAGKDGLLKAETLKRLHKPIGGGEYAGGWLIMSRDWGGGRVLTHSGSNNQNFCVVWMAPKRNFAVLIATNQGGDEAAQACDEGASALIMNYVKQTGQK